MQIVVLGMHRSGTSAAAQLLMKMGLYFAPEGMSNGFNKENPAGFWERKDVRWINDQILHSSGFDWDLVSGLEQSDLHSALDENHLAEMQRIVFELDAREPWFIKEPRLSLLFSVWRKVLHKPLCIFVYRNPIEVAQSLQRRNGMPEPVGRALTQFYSLSALQQARGLPILPIKYDTLLEQPTTVVNQLYDFFNAHGITGLKEAAELNLGRIIRSDLHRNRVTNESSETSLSANEVELLNALSQGPAAIENLPWPPDAEVMNQLASYQQEQLQQRSIETNDPLLSEFEKKTLRRLHLIDNRFTKLHEARRMRGKHINDGLARLEKKQADRDAVKKDFVEKQQELEMRQQKLNAQQKSEKLARNSFQQRYEKLEQALLLRRRGRVERMHTGVNLIASLASAPLRLGPRRGLALLKDFRQIRHSGQFDVAYYLRENPDVALSGINPILHFLQRGSGEGRAPRENFDVRQYALDKAVNPGRENPFAHYTRSGEVAHRPMGNAIRSDRDMPRKKVVVLCWDMGHNPVGRAYLLADLLSQQFTVELWGAHFPRFGSSLWGPLKDSAHLTIRTWPGADLPAYYETMCEQLLELRCDLLYVCKPRYPGIAFGMMAKHIYKVPVILDIDDYELAFFKDNETGSFAKAARNLDTEGSAVSHDAEWTSTAHEFIDFADAITVSNHALQQKFGGYILPHVRDEKKFRPNSEKRALLRKQLGIDESRKVILFLGTPRLHKGIAEVHSALRTLSNSNYLQVVIGSPVDPEAKKFFASEIGPYLIQHDDVPFNELQDYLNIADMMCLIQAPDSEVSAYQLPAKLIDAIAMSIPVVASNVPPLQDYITSGLVVPATAERIAESIDGVFRNYAYHKKIALGNRAQFLRKLSYSAHRQPLHRLIDATCAESSLLDDKLSDEKIAIVEHIVEKLPAKLISQLDELATHYNGAAAGPSYNIVYFWKQNDSGIYGRRQDMLVKYLKQHPRVNKLVHIDAPVSRRWLFTEWRKSLFSNSGSQARLVVSNTLRRWMGKTDGKVFVHGGLHNSLASYLYEYLDYLAELFNKEQLFEPNRKTVFVVCPRSFEFPYIAKRFKPDLVFADVIDNHLMWPVNEQMVDMLKNNYRELLSLADVAVTNNSNNQKELNEYSENIELVPNAAEYFSDAELEAFDKPLELGKISTPIVGYVGNLDSLRLDMSLIEALVSKRPDYTFLFLGSMHQNNEALALDKYPNVQFLGTKPYDEALRYIKYFDVAHIPHADNKLTRIMDPLKLYVYLAIGVPVVSTDVALNTELQKQVSVAKTIDEYIDCIDVYCKGGPGSDANQLQKRPKLDDSNMWPSRVDSIIALLDEAE